jgi:hypothetical protein
MKSRCIVAALLYSFHALAATAQGHLENPAPGSAQSGISVISGWHCSASRIEIVIDNGQPVPTATRNGRADTLGACGHKDTGFSLLVNWSTLPVDCFGCRFHTVRAYADGVQFADVRFEVEHFGTEYLTGKKAQYDLANFPEIGHVTTLRWDEEKQNFSVSFTARNQTSLSGKYFGALQIGKTSPACGPYPIDRVLPVKHGTFLLDVKENRLAMTASFVDGTTCRLESVPLLASPENLDGYVSALFDAAATASCPGLTGGLLVRTNGQRLTANTQDDCGGSGHLVGAKALVAY